MKNFKLRFRRTKLVAALAIAGTLVTSGLLANVSMAEAAVRLDVAYGSRLVTGPGSPTDFANETAVQHGNVVQFGIFVHNVEDATSGPTAKNFKVKVTIPKTPAPEITSTATVTADNGSSPAPYDGTDPTILKSANGKAFKLNNIRMIQLQRNDVQPTNDPTFNWKPLEDVPDSQITASHTAENFVYTIQPNADGDLGPCYQNALRIVFMADVHQGPTLKINKQVRMAGQTNWMEENTGRARDEMEYQIRVENQGPGPATNVVVRDSLPPHVTYVTGSCQMKLGLTAVQPCPDEIVKGGVKFANMVAGNVSYFLIKVKINENVPCSAKFLKNVAGINSDQTEIVWDTVTTTLVCIEVTPTPTPTPTVTPTPTPTATPTPPTPPVPPKAPPGPTELPKTGAAEAAALSLFALATSLYLFLRERRKMALAIRSYRVSK